MNPPSSLIHHVAGVVLLREDGAALLQLRDERPGLRLAGQWVFPGGHCEEGERIEDCARREFFEETDYRCGVLNPLVQFLDDTEAEVQDLTFFWASYDGAQTPRCLEGQTLEFVPRERAAGIKAPPYLARVWDLALESAAALKHRQT